MMQSGGMNIRSRTPTLGRLSKPTKTDATPRIAKGTLKWRQQGCLPRGSHMRRENTTSARENVLDVEDKDTRLGNVPRDMQRREDQVEETATRSDKG